jgi:hypothetical protein
MKRKGWTAAELIALFMPESEAEEEFAANCERVR